MKDTGKSSEFRSGEHHVLNLAIIFTIVLAIAIFLAFQAWNRFVMLEEKVTKIMDDSDHPHQEFKSLKDDIDKANKNILDNKNNIEQNALEIQSLQERVKNIEMGVGIVYSAPCWFIFDEERGKGPERHVKIFDIKIEDDDKFTVRRHKNTPKTEGKIKDMRDSTVDVLEDSAFPNSADTAVLNLLAVSDKPDEIKKIPGEEFRNKFMVFLNAGMSGEIRRGHDCRFMVDVYDYTGNDKEKYKEAIMTIEEIFYIYKVQKDKWDK